MEQLILEGRISVNNEPAHIGQRIQFGDQSRSTASPSGFASRRRRRACIAYHKPVGEVVTHDDPQNRPTVFRKLPKLPQGKWQSVGRLDLNTEGLLLFTNSGELANKPDAPALRAGARIRRPRAGRAERTRKAACWTACRWTTAWRSSARFKAEGRGEGANPGTASPSPRAATARCGACSRPSATPSAG
jgi:23S rRNA pseudouridine2605 synthase